jgi:hypothetical protein
LAQRLARGVGQGERHEERGAHAPHRCRSGSHLHRPVPVNVKDPASLRRHEERGQQHRADGEHRGRLTDRTHHGQSVGGEHARVRKPEQHQRLRGGQRREGCRDDDGETGGGKQQPT